jgi:signal transduction histidine kinase
MNLLQKSTRYQLRYLPFVLLICTLLFFLLLKIQTTHLQEVQLLLKQENVLNRFPTGPLDTTQNIIGEYHISINGPINPRALKEPVDTLIYYPLRKEFVPFQMRTTLIARDGKVFGLTTFVSSVEISHLIIAVLAGQFLIYSILLFAIIKINKLTSVTLWKPFYRTMEALDKYNINTHQSLDLKQDVDIAEFNELNWVINQLIERNRVAYKSQKEFVENASHEIQTPLAIIRSKVELLMEYASIDEKSADLISEIALANNRLSTLNRTLILLTKIENAQFINKIQINLSNLIATQLNNLSKYYIDHTPSIKQQLQEDVRLYANPELIEILCSNLIRNAFIHNIEGGYISVFLTSEQLLIKNSGKPLTIPPHLLFDRFQTGNSNSKKTIGLGLSLVKQICELYHYQVEYFYEKGEHQLKIIF